MEYDGFAMKPDPLPQGEPPADSDSANVVILNPQPPLRGTLPRGALPEERQKRAPL